MSNPRPRRGKKRRREHNDSTIELPNGKKHRKLCDDNQSQSDRRKLRVEYRKLHEQTAEDRPEIVDVGTEKFQNYCTQQDALFDRVSYPSEAYLDIQQSKTIASFLVEQTQDLANAQFTFNPTDIMAAIKTKFRSGNGGIDWARIGEAAAPYFRCVPRVRMMNGKMQRDVVDAPVKARRQYKKKIEKDDEPATQPSVLHAKDIKSRDKTETKSRIQKLKKTLRDRDAVPDTRDTNVFELLVNPNSYSETVENFFDMSFLCRQGFTQLEVDQNSHQPIITFVSTEENKIRKKQEETLSNSQCIVRLDPMLFCDVVDTYNISESQIKRNGGAPDSDIDNDPALDALLGNGEPVASQPRRSQRHTVGRKVAPGKRQLDSDSDYSE